MRFSFRYRPKVLPRLASGAAALGFASAQVTTYYVEQTASIDTDAGTSPTLPWKNAPGIGAYLVIGNPALGDRFHFANCGIRTFRIFSATTLDSPELGATAPLNSLQDVTASWHGSVGRKSIYYARALSFRLSPCATDSARPQDAVCGVRLNSLVKQAGIAWTYGDFRGTSVLAERPPLWADDELACVPSRIASRNASGSDANSRLTDALT